MDRRSRADPPSWTPVPDPTTRSLELVDREIKHQKEQTDLQFSLIDKQRIESDALVNSQRIESKADNKEAIAAALAAQKEAQQVFGASITEQIKSLQTAFTSSFEGIRKDIAELKEGAKIERGRDEGLNVASRLDAIKAQIDSNTADLLTGQGHLAGAKDSTARAIALVSVLVAAGGFLVTAVGLVVVLTQ